MIRIKTEFFIWVLVIAGIISLGLTTLFYMAVVAAEPSDTFTHYDSDPNVLARVDDTRISEGWDTVHPWGTYAGTFVFDAGQVVLYRDADGQCMLDYHFENNQNLYLADCTELQWVIDLVVR